MKTKINKNRERVRCENVKCDVWAKRLSIFNHKSNHFNNSHLKISVLIINDKTCFLF